MMPDPMRFETRNRYACRSGSKHAALAKMCQDLTSSAAGFCHAQAVDPGYMPAIGQKRLFSASEHYDLQMSGTPL